MKKTSRPQYSMLIEWSDEDQAYVVTFPEWAGLVNAPTTHGATYEFAARHGQEALDGLITMWQEHGRDLPPPQTR